MITCSHCGYDNRDGVMVCANCGREMHDTTVIDPTHLVRPKEMNSAAEPAGVPEVDRAWLCHDLAIALYVQGASQPVVLEPAARIILGRAAGLGEEQPDVDLTGYDAVKKGVSRHHAMLECHKDGLILVDQASINGTFVNGQRLIPYDPHRVRNGDEIRLGALVLYCYFNLDF